MTPLPRAALVDLVQQLSGISAVWVDEMQPFIPQSPDDAIIRLDVISYAAKGVDDVRNFYDPAKDVQGYTVEGQREFTLQVRVDSYDLDTFPMDVLEDLRGKLRSKGAELVMDQAGLALTDFPGEARKVPAEDDNRARFSASMDVRFNFSTTQDHLDDDRGDYIATVDSPGDVVPGTITP